MLVVQRERQNAVFEAMKEYREMPFMFERSGSKVTERDRCQRSEIRGQRGRKEVRRQGGRNEVGCQRSEVRGEGQKSDVSGQTSDVRRARAWVGDRKSAGSYGNGTDQFCERFKSL